MSQQEPEDQEQPGGCSAGACFAGPESPNAEKAAVRAPRDDVARWAGGAVIPCPALLLLLQTRKTLHHKGVWPSLARCTVLYCTVQYCTVISCTVLYCTVLSYTLM